MSAGRHRPARRDTGSIAPAVPVIALVMLLMGGLVIDASRLLMARSRATAHAEEAARAGAAAVDLTQTELTLLGDDVVTDQVERYCAEAAQAARLGRSVLSCALDGIDHVSAEDQRRIVVRVRSRVTVPAGLLGLVGVGELTAVGLGKARPVEGIDQPDPVAPSG